MSSDFLTTSLNSTSTSSTPGIPSNSNINGKPVVQRSAALGEPNLPNGPSSKGLVARMVELLNSGAGSKDVDGSNTGNDKAKVGNAENATEEETEVKDRKGRRQAIIYMNITNNYSYENAIKGEGAPLKIGNYTIKSVLDKRLTHILRKYGDNGEEFKAQVDMMADRAKKIDEAVGNLNLSKYDEKKIY